MEIRKLAGANIKNLKANQLPKGEKRENKAEIKDDVSFFKNASRTENGNFKFIISGKDAKYVKKFIKKNGGKIIDKIDLINGYVVELEPNKAGKFFKSAPKDVKIFLDEKVAIPKPEDFSKMNEVSTLKENIPTKAKLRPDPTIKTMGIDKLWEKGYTGKGVTIAVIDTGVYPHPDFKDRIVGFIDLVNGKKEPYDDNGHGTHCVGDAAEDGKYPGPAKEANIVGIKVLNAQGSGSFSTVLKGIQAAVENAKKYGIKILSLSLGGYAMRPWSQDPVALAIDAAAKKGLIPVIAAGNSGPRSKTIGTPGITPSAITVGASDTSGTVEKNDDKMARFSSRGPTIDNLHKPDVVAPGVLRTAANAPGSTLDKYPTIPHSADGKYIQISGTSMATPTQAGIIALLVQANPNLTAADVKEIIKECAVKLEKNNPNVHYTVDDEGFGQLDVQKALDMAIKMKESK